MSERTLHIENLANIEYRIAEVELRITELQARIRELERQGLNTEQTNVLLEIMHEHLELVNIRRRLALQAIRADKEIGSTGCKAEY